jgi:hypothetical protein
MPVDLPTLLRDFLLVATTGATIGTVGASGGLSASATSIPLNAGFTPLKPGRWPIKIVGTETELIVVTQAVRDTLAVEPLGRGAYNTAAVTHPNGAAVTLATIPEMFGSAVFNHVLEEENEDPAIVIDAIQDLRRVSAVERGPATLRVYGGEDSEKNKQPSFAEAAARVVADRMDDVYDNRGEAVDSGRLMEFERESFQLLDEPDTDPPWPVVAITAQVEARYSS